MHTLARAIICGLVVVLGFACSGSDGGRSTTPSPSGPSSLTPTAGAALPLGRTTFYGADAGDQAGAIVAGDFNGDAATDVVVGAALADGPNNGRVDGGEVYLFLGPFPKGGSLDASSRQYDAIFSGVAAADNLGRTLAAGDFNGDGVDDLAIAAPAANEQAGATYVMFGAQWPEQIDFAHTDPDVLLTGAAPSDFAGISLAASDLDADGADELIVGSLLNDGPNGSRTDAGSVYVLRGQQLIAGNDLELASVTSVVYGAHAGDHLGEALGAGDVTGDGRDDLVLAATFSSAPDGSRPGAGATYVLESPVTSFPLDLATAAPTLTIYGTDEGDQLGHSLGVGDVNGDGRADLWLGAVSADGPGNQADLMGEGKLILSSPSRRGAFDTATVSSDATVYGPERNARLGRSAAAGDVDGDGRADLLISSPNTVSRAGRVYVLTGGGDYPEDVSAASTTVSGVDAGDLLGHESFGTPSLSVASVAGQERPALLVSAPGGDGPDNGRTDCGEAYLIPGVLLGSR